MSILVLIKDCVFLGVFSLVIFFYLLVVDPIEGLAEVTPDPFDGLPADFLVLRIDTKDYFVLFVFKIDFLIVSFVGLLYLLKLPTF